MYKYCLARLNGNKEYAEDCVQDTFLVFYNKLKSGEEINNPRAFLYATATNFIKKKFNEIKKQTESQVELESVKEVTVIDESAEEQLNYSELSNYLTKRLNKRETELFNLRFVQGEKIKIIAEQLKITPANCSIRVTRLRRKLINLLDEY